MSYSRGFLRYIGVSVRNCIRCARWGFSRLKITVADEFSGNSERYSRSRAAGRSGSIVQVETQEEIDALWNQLTSNDGEPGQCGWLRDQFGLSWQVEPTTLYQLLSYSATQRPRPGAGQSGDGDDDGPNQDHHRRPAGLGRHRVASAVLRPSPCEPVSAKFRPAVRSQRGGLAAK